MTSPVAWSEELDRIVGLVRSESGIETGCPLCGGHFSEDTGVCADCGIDIVADWQAGSETTERS